MDDEQDFPLTCIVAVKRGTASRVDTALRVVSALREDVAARAAAGLRAVAALRAIAALGFFIAVEDILTWHRGSHATCECPTRSSASTRTPATLSSVAPKCLCPRARNSNSDGSSSANDQHMQQRDVRCHVRLNLRTTSDKVWLPLGSRLWRQHVAQGIAIQFIAAADGAQQQQVADPLGSPTSRRFESCQTSKLLGVGVPTRLILLPALS